MFTCTGSEANDLALRVARAATGGTGVIVTDNAYHGVTLATAGAKIRGNDEYDLRAPHAFAKLFADDPALHARAAAVAARTFELAEFLLHVVGFQRLAVGEGIEKKVDDFAAEVAAQVASAKQSA